MHFQGISEEIPLVVAFVNYILALWFTGIPRGNFQATQTQNFNGFHVDLCRDSEAKNLVPAHQWG